jgi:hypothetical protein
MDLLSLVLGGKVLGGHGGTRPPVLSELLIIKNGTYLPAKNIDGWDKVVVDVASDIIDVDELPTEEIEQGKIYRLIKEDGTIVYGIPDEINGKTVYTYENNEWTEISGSEDLSEPLAE